MNEITGHDWKGNKVQFMVRWTVGDHTWEMYNTCKELITLDDYFALHGVTDW